VCRQSGELQAVTLRFVVLLAACCGFALGTAQAQQAAESSTEREAKAREYFTDTVLRTHADRAVKFYSDALKDKVVLVNFVFTQCGDTCPLITARLVQVKKELGEAFGRDVRFLSISVDPEHDRPQDLARFARKFDAVHPEWWFLTGEKANAELVVKKLGAYTPERESHLTAIMIGAASKARWKRVRPDAPPKFVADALRDLVASSLEQ
jgi:cytochrome oxidase Cu insertion factor (SCO1/SenC/PrrC family)